MRVSLTGRLALPLMAAALLAACTVGPNYKRPVVATPQGWREAPAASATAGPGASAGAGAAAAAAGTATGEAAAQQRSIADLEWWNLFQDSALQTLITEALVDNKDLRLAAARIQEARARLGITRSDQYPRVDAGVGAARNRTTEAGLLPAGIDPEAGNFRLGGNLSFELDLWGRLRRSTEAARAALLASEESHRTVRLALVRDVSQMYFELRDLDLQLEIARRALETRDASLRLARARKAGGITSDLDVQQAEAEHASARAVIATLELSIAQQEHELSVLLGRNPGAVARGAALTDQIVPPDVPAGLPSALLERRPDIREAEQQLVAANAVIGAAQAARFPRISLTGALGLESRELSDLFTGPARVWTLAAGAAAPVFDAGRNRNTVEAAKARYEQAAVIYEQVVQQAFREVEDALIAHRKTREVRESQEAQVAATERSLRLAEARYRGGLSSYLEVLDSQRQLLTAELQLSQTRRAHLVSVVHLYGALGGGWQQ